MEGEKIGNPSKLYSKYGSVYNNIYNPLSFKLHSVDKNDTLISVAIQYDVPVDDIKKCNGLWSNSFIYRKELKIPILLNQTMDYENLEEFLTDSHDFNSCDSLTKISGSRSQESFKNNEISFADYLAKIDENINRVKSSLTKPPQKKI